MPFVKIRSNLDDQPTAQPIREARNKLYPPHAEGEHVGIGPWVDMPGTWDAQGPVPPGWSGMDGEVEQEAVEDDEFSEIFPTVDEAALSPGKWALGFPEGMDALVNANPGGVLTAPEQAMLLAEWAAADEVPDPPPVP